MLLYLLCNICQFKRDLDDKLKLNIVIFPGSRRIIYTTEIGNVPDQLIAIKLR